MDESGSEFLELLERVRIGDEAATETLWNDYYHSLVRLAAKRMPPNLRRTADEEDIAIAAFQSFIAGVRRDQFPDLHAPENLWGLLITLTSRKVNAHLRHHTRQKRGGGNIRGESVFIDPNEQGREVGIGNVPSDDSSPDVRAELAEACETLLDQLGDEQLRQIAVMRMDGFLVDEIAERLELSKRAVERRLQLIRRMWTEAKADEAKADEAS
ncbi:MULTISPECIES: ECF-type sigma factor [Novipirellula]|uniref:ECF-type sigma factor n=1 Tax=Novipirellula rosea TaxID=1031540 RepID=A0ABP8MPP9_9BACT|tara:strand:- start:486 stop:1124 length:639 start_codon:yes stop_codon:yes gene_type:complete